jgi:cation transport regulator ChaC
MVVDPTHSGRTVKTGLKKSASLIWAVRFFSVRFFWRDRGNIRNRMDNERGGVRVLYFAYGSCMLEESFCRTVGTGNYEVLGKAVVNGYRLSFTLYSANRKGGVADLVPDPDGQVEGVLYRLSPEALPLLDEREGVGIGRYRRKEVTVIHQGEPVRAMTYEVVNKERTELPPSWEYAGLIARGAERFLSGEYRRRLACEWLEKFGIDYSSLLDGHGLSDG